MKNNNPSKEQLSKSLDRRIRHLMITTLERFENSFPDIDSSKDGQIFKGDIRNSFNDVLRAQRDEINDYEVEYRPLRLNQDNTLAMTQTFMKTVQKILFSVNKQPSIKIYSGLDKRSVLDAIRSEFGTGVIYEENDSLVLEIVGVQSCVDSVLFIMDRYYLHSEVRLKYQEWRRKVIEMYRRQDG